MALLPAHTASMVDGQRLERPFGEELLEVILRDGSAPVSSSSGALANSYYISRVQDKRLALGNPDRPRVVPGSDSLAHRQIHKRNRRLVQRAGITADSNGKGHAEGGETKPFSRRQRQRLGLEEVDDNVSFESLMPIHQLWLDYVHRLLGFVDENGKAHSSQLRMEKAKEGGAEQVAMNANAINTFQTSVVKANLCGAPMRVTRALNPSLVGIEGLVAKETASTLVIVTRSQRPATMRRSRKLVKVIPKQNTIFTLQIPLPAGAIPSSASANPQPPMQLQIALHGNQLCNNMQTRATKKFKARKTVDL